MLTSLNGDKQWIPWRFTGTNTNWNDKQTRIEYFKWLEKKLQIKDPEDWYQVNFIPFLSYCS